MIHELEAEQLDNQYYNRKPEGKDHVCFVSGGKILLCEKDGQLSWPNYEEVKDEAGQCVYLFSIGESRYFLAEFGREPVLEHAGWMNWRRIRSLQPKKEAFAAMTAMHLGQWYASVQYCGACGKKAVHDETERMMRCPHCGLTMYPKISPAVIVAVTDENNRLLLTKYAERMQDQYALVAGFTEIGETLEECVQRELMEEVGLKVKDIRYYASQPWGFAGNLMVGFTAKLDGSDQIHMDQRELGLAEWLTPEEIPDIDDYSSLTREMIRRFKYGCL